MQQVKTIRHDGRRSAARSIKPPILWVNAGIILYHGLVHSGMCRRSEECLCGSYSQPFEHFVIYTHYVYFSFIPCSLQNCLNSALSHVHSMKLIVNHKCKSQENQIHKIKTIDNLFPRFSSCWEQLSVMKSVTPLAHSKPSMRSVHSVSKCPSVVYIFHLVMRNPRPNITNVTLSQVTVN